MSEKTRAMLNIDADVSSPKNERRKSHSKSKSREANVNESTIMLLQVDDLEYKHQMEKKSANASTKDLNIAVIKRDMIPALPSRHGSRADTVVPLHSQARLRAEKILSHANEFHALFEDDDFSILDQCSAFELQLRKESSKRKSGKGQSHSMAMNVWRANKLKSISPNQYKQQSPESSHLTSIETNSGSPFSIQPDDSSSSTWSNCNEGWMHETSKVSAAQETLPQITSLPMQLPKMRIRNDQVSDALLHNAIMNDVVQALAKQPLQHQANPYVSMVDIRFKPSTNFDVSSNGKLTDSKTITKRGHCADSIPMPDAMERTNSSTEQPKKSKVTKAIISVQKKSLDATDTDFAMDEDRFQLQCPFRHQSLCNSPSPGRQKRESPTLAPLQSKSRITDAQNQIHEFHPRQTSELKLQQHSLSKTEFELIGHTIASEDGIAKIESRLELLEAIELNAAERFVICTEIDRCCLKLQKQWQVRQKTILCKSNTRLKGSTRSQLLMFLRSLRENQRSFYTLALRYNAYFCDGSSSMSRKVERWKQQIEHHMHELVKLPTVADVINEVALEGTTKSNSFKSSIGTFSGCANSDLAAAAACSKLLLGSKDSESASFSISGNNVAPSNGQLSSIMLSPCEPIDEYNKVGVLSCCFIWFY
jgi:hypothetical protein